MNTYEINNRNEVIPYTSGRRCTDTMAWRDATEFELQQQDEIKTLETELTAAREELKAVTEQRDAASAEFYRYHGLWDRATKQLETVMYQRDRLAEALKKAKAVYTPSSKGEYQTGWHDAICWVGQQALQSLNQPTEP